MNKQWVECRAEDGSRWHELREGRVWQASVEQTDAGTWLYRTAGHKGVAATEGEAKQWAFRLARSAVRWTAQETRLVETGLTTLRAAALLGQRTGKVPSTAALESADRHEISVAGGTIILTRERYSERV